MSIDKQTLTLTIRENVQKLSNTYLVFIMKIKIIKLIVPNSSIESNFHHGIRARRYRKKQLITWYVYATSGPCMHAHCTLTVHNWILVLMYAFRHDKPELFPWIHVWIFQDQGIKLTSRHTGFWCGFTTANFLQALFFNSCNGQCRATVLM